MKQNAPSLIDWMVEVAAYMRRDRPDNYPTYDDAFNELQRIIGELSSQDHPGFWHFGGFFIHKWVEDGVIEYYFCKKVASAHIFEDDGETQLYGWTSGSGTMKDGPELPSPEL